MSALCAFPDDVDKLEHIFDMLSAVWIKQDNDSRIPVSDLIEHARKINPSYMRVPGDWSVPQEVRVLLGEIDGFEFEICHGFFSWSYKQVDFGQLPYGCDDSKFEKFTDLIVANKPSSFEDLEQLLLS